MVLNSKYEGYSSSPCRVPILGYMMWDSVSFPSLCRSMPPCYTVLWSVDLPNAFLPSLHCSPWPLLYIELWRKFVLPVCRLFCGLLMFTWLLLSCSLGEGELGMHLFCRLPQKTSSKYFQGKEQRCWHSTWNTSYYRGRLPIILIFIDIYIAKQLSPKSH